MKAVRSPACFPSKPLQEVVSIASNQTEARRRAQQKLKSAGASRRDVAKLCAARDAAQAEEDRGRTGGLLSRIAGW